MIQNDCNYPIYCLTNDQVDQLYNFTRKHFVEYYDLQSELVDHLANGIEKQWEGNAKIDFNEALQIEFKKFGVYGFSDIVEKRTIQMKRRYHKFVWQHFKDFFTVPKLFFTISLIIILTVVLINLSAIASTVVMALACIVFFITVVISIKKHLYKKQSSSKSWLMQDIINSYGGAAGLWFIPFQLIFQFKNLTSTNNIFILSFFSSFIVCWILYSYIMIYIIPIKAESYLNEVYPEYKYV